MSGEKYNTNLASEFYVLSLLHRLGMDAMLTLGNKKSVDLVAVNSEGKSYTIDVKGLAGKTSWPVDNVKLEKASHFLVFVCYHGAIANLAALPETWVIPSAALTPFIYHAPGGRKVVERRRLLKEAELFKDAWHLLTGLPES